ncbi:endonuclease/exonuclease/phosphatase family protein [Parapedobacter tibetensis]|uniref:endonuclease/exonuclease/phosphatase family protein n=1 Tax=Parapedobacter tibetensis TaxID=2972951 RepID=UPI00214DE8EC|nr:endonuclease/exonuclease/phosphatase family protein [Parapedobacter tibetensis]
MYKHFIICLLLCLPGVMASAQELKVMTYNIYHGEHNYNPGNSNLQEIADIINAYKPDFVALQEVDSMTNRTAGFNNGVPKDLVQELAKLTGMHGYFAKAIDYSNGGYGEGVLSRWPSEAKRDTLPLPEGGEARALLSVTYTLPDGNQLIFAGTHLCHKSEANRIAQVEAINTVFENQAIPVIMGGDFNFRPDTEPYQVISEKFLDAAREYGKEENTIPFENPQSRIDYVFLSKGKGHKWDIKDIKVIKENPSDHMPVLVTLELLK